MERCVSFEHASHRFRITDTFRGTRRAAVEEGSSSDPTSFSRPLEQTRSHAPRRDRAFQLVVDASASSSARVDPIEIGVEYGRRVPSSRVVFSFDHLGPLTEFHLEIAPS